MATHTPTPSQASFLSELDNFRSQSGESLAALSDKSPVLVVFLRHGGCPFCREALADLAKKRAAIEQGGTRIALVHMMTDAQGAALFAQYGLQGLPRFSDPDRRLYAAFEVPRGGVGEVMGVGVWARGLGALLQGQLPGLPRGDVFQLPGSFLIHHGKILKAFRGKTSADRPDYEELAACELPPQG